MEVCKFLLLTALLLACLSISDCKKNKNIPKPKRTTTPPCRDVTTSSSSTTATTTTATTTSFTTNPTTSPQAINKPVPSKTYMRYSQLDSLGNYHLYWDFNDTHITFEVHVNTTGWVGFGISPNGGMLNSDLIMGWVRDGQAYFKDRNTIGFDRHRQPAIDSEQNWFLIKGWKYDFGTALNFYRQLDTGDAASDIPITESTTRVIFSWNTDEAPVNETAPRYHGSDHRGTKSLYLLDKQPVDVPLPPDTRTYEVLNDFVLPNVTTYYSRRTDKIPDLSGKHHLIRYEAVITPGHELIVHHMILYQCPFPINDSLLHLNYSSDGPYPDLSLLSCITIVAGWAVGGGAFVFPENVGYPIGTDTSYNSYVLEIHYNNPNQMAGEKDTSGIRLYLTSTLRHHDAGVLTIGFLHESKVIIIPPNAPAFLSGGLCSATCTSKFQNPPLNAVYSFALLQHSHLLGRKIKTRHFRNGVEMPNIANDQAYDFNFQEYRHLNNEITILPNDTMLVECTYNSTGRTNITMGGEPTTSEMCLTFLLYYPKQSLSMCRSHPSYLTYSLNNITEAAMAKDWTDQAERESFQYEVSNSPQTTYCMQAGNPPPTTIGQEYLPN